MMITINLKPEIEVQVREKAKLQDLSLEQYIESLIEKEIVGLADKYPLPESAINTQDSVQAAVSIDEWEKQLLKFINLPLDSNPSLLSDEAISRENIYTREDEML